MNFNLYDRTIWLVLTGSRGYGTFNEDSDWDYRGICIPPLNSYIGILNKFEQVVDSGKNAFIWKMFPKRMVKENADMQVMEISKFIKLAAEGNPNVIEILFTHPSNFIFKRPIMDKLLENKNLFLSKRLAPRFVSYALDQLKRAASHKEWLDNPPISSPNREDFGLPPSEGLLSADQLGAADALIQKEIDSFVVDQDDLPEHTKLELSFALSKMMRTTWKALHHEPFPVGKGQKYEHTSDALKEELMRNEGFSENFIEVLKREKQYRAAKTRWASYQKWLKERNPERAKLEAQFGYDSKNCMHLVRLIRTCREIFETGEVHVLRPDAEELKQIRNGAWSYEKILEFGEKQKEEIDILVKNSSLPKNPDMNKIQDLIFDMVIEFNKELA